jgi:hypothetical protein
MSIDELRALWRDRKGQGPPKCFSKDLIARALAHRAQEEHVGGLDRRTHKLLASLARPDEKPQRRLKVGSVIVREHQGVTHEILVVPGGFSWRGNSYSSLSTIAKTITGTSWNGPRFFGLREEQIASEARSPREGRRTLAPDRGGPFEADRIQTEVDRSKVLALRDLYPQVDRA